MRSKEAILDKDISEQWCEGESVPKCRGWLLETMEEYAKETSLDFMDWLGRNRYQYKGWDSPFKWFRVDGNTVTSFRKEQLFDEYLKTKQ